MGTQTQGIGERGAAHTGNEKAGGKEKGCKEACRTNLEEGSKKVVKARLHYSRDSRTAVEALCHAEGDKEAGGSAACQPSRR